MGGARFSVWCPWPPVWTPHTITDSVNTDVATMTSIAGEQSRVVKPQDESFHHRHLLELGMTITGNKLPVIVFTDT